MKYRPILFSAPMVRALLDGSKTQTRRAVTPAPEMVTDKTIAPWQGDPVALQRLLTLNGKTCRYGQPGDRLYVRENGWQRPERTPKMMREGADTWAPYYYDADGLTEQDVADFKAWGFKRRPSIHMPRVHSRILLEIVNVRVERLRDISEADCIAEGASGGHGSIPGYTYNATPLEHYSYIWEQINGAGSWALNPWVWVVEFKRSAVSTGGGEV